MCSVASKLVFAVAAVVALPSCGPLLGLDEDMHLIDGDEDAPSCAEGCVDGNPCTIDVCEGQMCMHRGAPDGPAPEQVTGDCQRIECFAGVASSTADDEDRPADESCAEGACDDGRPAPIPLSRGLPCSDEGGVYCDGLGACVECLGDEHCSVPDTCGGDGITGFCGCRPLSCSEQELTCGAVSDGCYAELDCDNNEIDGSESDIDCGGATQSCAARCADGRVCTFGSDCQSGFCAAARCEPAWSGGFGDTSAQHARAVASDIEGNIIVVGEFSGTVDFGTGPLTSTQGAWELFVAKFSAAGQPLWSRQFGGSGAPAVNDVGVDLAGNVVLVGWFSGVLDFGATPLVSGSSPSGYVTKLDGLGNALWSIELSNDSASSSEVTALALRDNGEIVVAGAYDGSLALSQNALISDGLDAFVVELTSAGGVSGFVRGFGGSGQQRAVDVAVAPSGKLALVGNFTGAAVVGGQVHVSKGDWDGFVAMLDDAGDALWSKAFGHAGQQTLSAVAVDPDEHVVIGGSYFQAIDLGSGIVPSAGADDVFVVELDPSGTVAWGNRYGDVQSQQLADLRIDARGDVVVAGSFAGALAFGAIPLVSAGGVDVFVAKLDQAGGHVWSRRYGDGGAQLANEVAITPFGSIVVVGDFASTINFGQGSFTAGGGSDVFVAALPP
jgi:hypothetical protein